MAHKPHPGRWLAFGLLIGAMASPALAQQPKQTPAPAAPSPAKPQGAAKPNIVIIWGDDIGQSNLSAYTNGLMGYRTPNIDSIATDGMIFTD
jgi:arylsulfatase